MSNTEEYYDKAAEYESLLSHIERLESELEDARFDAAELSSWLDANNESDWSDEDTLTF